MKAEKLIWGLTLVFVGTILLLDNFGVIDFYWRSVWHFWPLILILVGLNLVVGRNKNQVSKTILIVITCAVLAFIAYLGITHPRNQNTWSWRFNTEEKDSDSADFSSGSFTEPMQPGIQRAELHIKGGATRYTLNEPTDQLFAADVERAFGKFSLRKISRDSVEILQFNMNGKDEHFDLEDMDQNRAAIRLNTQPIWAIFLDMGAGKADFDLSAYQVERLQVKGGAASFQLKLGLPAKQTAVSVEAGLAEVKLEVPEAVGCQIVVKSGLSDRDFIGFDKQADGTYTTPNFTSAAKKIFINLKGGLSDFEVTRY